MLPDASFKEVLSIKGRFAVGRLRNGCVRVLDDTGLWWPNRGIAVR